MNGGSTGLAPIHVRSETKVTNNQKFIFLLGLNFLFILFFFIVNTARIRIDPTMASTPPSLEGIERRIA